MFASLKQILLPCSRLAYYLTTEYNHLLSKVQMSENAVRFVGDSRNSVLKILHQEALASLRDRNHGLEYLAEHYPNDMNFLLACDRARNNVAIQ